MQEYSQVKWIITTFVVAAGLSSCRSNLSVDTVTREKSVNTPSPTNSAINESQSLTFAFGNRSLGANCKLTQLATASIGGAQVNSLSTSEVSISGANSNSYTANANGFEISLNPYSLNPGSSFDATWHVVSGATDGSVTKTFDVTATGSLLPLSIPSLTINAAAGRQPAIASDCNGGIPAAVGGGNAHACTLTSTGRVLCWGQEGHGALGFGLAANAKPLQVTGIDGTAGNQATKISVGSNSGCAIMTGGAVKCWGYNQTVGNMGVGTTTAGYYTSPVQVTGIDGSIGNKATDLSNGFYDTICAVIDDGTVRCWGRGFTSTPTTVAGIDGTAGNTAMKVGSFYGSACAILDSGAVKCWGSNNHGQIGQGSVGGTYASATAVSAIDGSTIAKQAVAINGGNWNVCALMADGKVMCWGNDGDGGAVGNGAATGDVSTPTAVANITGAAGFKAVSVARSIGSTYCAIMDDGRVMCWGLGAQGQMGDGASSSYNQPTNMSTFDGTASKQLDSLAQGWVHACAIYSGGRLACMGRMSRLSLAELTYDPATPETIDEFNGTTGKQATQVSVGDFLACAMKSNGGVWCWGSDSRYLGAGQPSFDAPTLVPNIGVDMPAAVQLIGGERFSCTLLMNGAVSCWGWNNGHGIGLGPSKLYAWTPTILPQIDGSTNKKAIAIGGGGWTPCALMEDRSLKCWGWGTSGSVGDGNNVDQYAPVQVSGLDGSSGNKVLFLAQGGYANHTCAIVETGAMKCWGYGFYGEVGNGNTADVATPADVTGIDGSDAAHTAVNAAVGTYHTCAIMAAGTVKCWGRQNEGELGNGATTSGSISSPVNVLTIDGSTGNKAVAVTAGYYHTCALLDGGAVKCWGKGNLGQRGEGSTTASVGTPVTVSNLGGASDPKAIAISAIGDSTCVATDTHEVWCWGYNSWGQLGNDSQINSSIPVQVLAAGAANGGAKFIQGATQRSIVIDRRP